MSSMAAALAAAGAAAGAGAASMAGMASAAGETNALPLLPRLFERLGLGVLNKLPNQILQPLLIFLLALSVGTAYLAHRGHRRPQALILSTASAVVMYLSIYVWMSDPLYWLSLSGLIGAGLWSIYLARHFPRVLSSSA
jgi:hypothetical protein